MQELRKSHRVSAHSARKRLRGRPSLNYVGAIVNRYGGPCFCGRLSLFTRYRRKRSRRLGALSGWQPDLGYRAFLGGPIGYAINPARDLGPRIANDLLPMYTLAIGCRAIPALARIHEICRMKSNELNYRRFCF